MNAETKRFITVLRDSNEPHRTARAMIAALLQHVEDVREDDPGDNEGNIDEILETLENALDTADHALATLL